MWTVLLYLKNQYLMEYLFLNNYHVIKNPMAPNKAIKKPIAAALPIALLIEYPKNFNIGTFITAPPIPIGAEIKPTKNPKIIFK